MLGAVNFGHLPPAGAGAGSKLNNERSSFKYRTDTHLRRPERPTGLHIQAFT